MKPITNEAISKLSDTNLEMYLKLGELHDLLSTSWTASRYACNEDGRDVSPISPEAVQWCVLGGISKLYNVEPHEIRRVTDATSARRLAIDNLVYFLERLIYTQLRGIEGILTLPCFNDICGQQAILDLITKAREYLLYKAQEA